MKFIITFALFVVVCAAKSEMPAAEIPIVRSTSDIDVDGSFKYGYETGNGISAIATGNADAGIQGRYKYTSPDGEQIELSYTADERGYLPKGKHLPVGPETPAYVLRALEWIRTHPSKEDKFLN